MGKKIISFLSDGILSGIFLCVGCCVSMSVESKPLGAFLFSLGLCAIIVFKFGLFTGKAGYMAVNRCRMCRKLYLPLSVMQQVRR